MSTFENVAPPLARALAARGYQTLTPVQLAIVEPEYAEADLIVSAQTGSGKTVAFGMSLAGQLLAGADSFGKAEAPLALVIAPTRELAMQVKAELMWLYAPAGASIASCVGGMDQREEQRALWRGAHIVVGTPGRISDHIRRGSLKLDGLKAVVLDEADEMLNLGFREELEFILEASPATRRTLMFSATMPKAIEALARKYQRDALRVNTVSGEPQHADIDYRAMVAASHEAENAIFNVLRYYDAPNALVFCSTRAAVTRMMTRFSNRGFAAVALSGELSQAQRTHALQALRDKRAQVCVATDVAARGIDLPELELVIHAEMPKSTETLLHRSGRTGRAGRKGTSVLIVPQKYRRNAERLLRTAGIIAEWSDPPSAADVRRKDDERLMADPVLYEPIDKDERAFLSTLMSAYEPEQIAAAFVRLHRKGKAAGEDLTPAVSMPDRTGPTPSQGARDANPARRDKIIADGPRKPPRNNFENGVWISLGVGRLQFAEPRWIIPVLCDAGEVTKKALGAIRIDDNDTYVEIDPEQADAFLGNIRNRGDLDRRLQVTQLDGEPAFSASQARPALRDRPHKRREDGEQRKPRRDYDKPREDRPREDRPHKHREDSDERKPRRDFDKAREDRPREDRPHKPRWSPDRDHAPTNDQPRTENRKARRAREQAEREAAGIAPPSRAPAAPESRPQQYEKRAKPWQDKPGKPAGKFAGKPRPQSHGDERPKRPGDQPKRKWRPDS